MSYSISTAERGDAPFLVKLLDDYMRETYHGAWSGNAAQLERDIIEQTFEMLVAEADNRQIVGFIAWVSTYDLHWCLKGAVVIDFYVERAHRGRGASVLLATELAATVQRRGGAFLHGGAVENESVRRLYDRVAMMQPNGECYISGRAFRHLADLSGKTLRDIVRNLPQASWNHEA